MLTLSPGHIAGAAGVMLKAGMAFTVTVAEIELEHPEASVAVTVYVVVATGFTQMVSAVAPVLHTNVEVAVLDVTVSFTESLAQIEAFAGVITGIGLTVIVVWVVSEHP